MKIILAPLAALLLSTAANAQPADTATLSPF
jgi:hypothetical protein